MRVWHIISLAAGLAGIGLNWIPASKPVAIVVSGDQKGYLSPCGCSNPMIGGIKRRASAVRSLSQTSRLIVVDNGGLVAGIKRQDEIKAEAMAEALALMGADAINLGVEEANLGKDMLASIQRLSDNKLISTQLPSPAPLGIKPYVGKNGYLVGGICMQTGPLEKVFSVKLLSAEKAASVLLAAAEKRKLKPFLLLRGSEEDAKAIARKNPKLAAIVFSGAGDPLATPVKVGKTLIITPGESGKYLVTLSSDSKGSYIYQSAALSPEYKDDPTVSGTYFAYLDRIKSEKLLDQWPRVETDEYAGSETCGHCHKRAFNTWKETSHATALESLERVGHDFDPDCVSCHVVGLSSKVGFVSRDKTPLLANVGCESCHGPLAAHAKSPKSKRPSRPQTSCTSCHDINHSTSFNFETYWSKIAHH